MSFCGERRPGDCGPLLAAGISCRSSWTRGPRRRSRADVYPTGALVVFPRRERSWWRRRPPGIGPFPPPGGPGAGREPGGEGVEEPAGAPPPGGAVVRGPGAIPPGRVAFRWANPPDAPISSPGSSPGGRPGKPFRVRGRPRGPEAPGRGLDRVTGVLRFRNAGTLRRGCDRNRRPSARVPARPPDSPPGPEPGGRGAARRERMAVDGDRVVQDLPRRHRRFGGARPEAASGSRPAPRYRPVEWRSRDPSRPPSPASVSAVSPGSKENADRRRPPARVSGAPPVSRRGPRRPVERAVETGGGGRYPARRMRRMGTGSFRICPCTTSTSVGVSVGSRRIASSTSRPRTTRPKVA